MSKPKPNLLLMIAIAIFMVAVVFNIAYADHHKHHDDVIVDVIGGNIDASSETIIGGHKSYGVSQSLGDVDINDCLASTQWGIPVIFAKQGVEENPWCMANSLDAMGAHEAAAKVRCTTETIKAIYPDPAICEKAVMFHVEPPDEPETVDRDDENYKRLYARISEMEAKSVQDQANTEKATQRAEAQAQAANTRLNQAEEDRKAYAQRMLEQLPEYNDGE